MAPKLVNRSTFIHVKKDPVAPIKLRSQSQPPLTRLCADYGDGLGEERLLSDYLATVLERAEHLEPLIPITGGGEYKTQVIQPDVVSTDRKRQPESASSTSHVSSFPSFGHPRTLSSMSSATETSKFMRTPDSMSSAIEASMLTCDAKIDTGEATVETPPSKGSKGHPEFCQRPCLFFPQGACRSGSECGFCHVEHARRACHLDKRNRERLKTISSSALMSLVLDLARKRALETGISNKASTVLQILETWSSTKSNVTPVMPEMRQLHGFLRVLPFSELIQLVIRRHKRDVSPEDTEFAKLLRDAVTRMGD